MYKKFPLNNSSLDAINSSHMLEHLSINDARSFLSESQRVLLKGGILRLAVPDLQIIVKKYLLDKDADAFVGGTLLATPPLKTFKDKLHLLVCGYSHHQWMYDGNSLKKRLFQAGFKEGFVQPPGKTFIKDYGKLNLQQRVENSVYIEAIK